MTPQTNMASGGRFTLGANAPSPASVVQSGSNGIVKFAGATVGGAYPISVIATDNAGSATATYTYYLSEPPGFPTAAGASAIDFWLMEGVAASISIPTTGYPHDVGVTNSTGKQLLPQMVLTLRDIPRGMTFTSTTAAGIPTGTGLLSGKPDAGSARDFRSILEANNGVRANIEVKYHVRKPGDVNDDGQVDCQDRTTLTDSFGLHSGQTGFDARADLNNDGTVDAADSAILTRFLGLVCGGTLPYNPL
jgi:hypothetical protein